MTRCVAMHSESPDRVDVMHSAAQRQYPERVLPLRRPEGHSPPIPRYSADLQAGKKIAVLFVGVQGRSIEVVRQANLSELCNNSEPQLTAPDYLDNAEYVDPEGYINHIAALYWLEASKFHEWLKSQTVARWRARIYAEQSIGIWWKPIAISTERLETITFKEYRRGVSACPAPELVLTPGTGYWGAARDRIPASAHDRFEPSISELDILRPPTRSFGRHLVVQPPMNMIVIRSGVSWASCRDEQLKDYHQHIKPKLDAGMDYLRRFPQETGCCVLRQVVCTTPQGDALEEAYSLGCFISMEHLERWAKDHPTHLAIYSRAMAARRKYQDRLELRTYNEIFVLESDNPAFEYVNCHPRTGLLPYFDSIECARG